jgi:molybdate transport system permease protein
MRMPPVPKPAVRSPAAGARQPEAGARSRLFAAVFLSVVGLFVAAVLALVIADAAYVDLSSARRVLASPEFRAALWLSLWTSTLTAVLGVAVAAPVGYALSRFRFPGYILVDSIVDLPIVLPPLVLGLSLLVFFHTSVGKWIESLGLTFVYERRGIVLCQFLVSASFGIRAAKVGFDGVDRRLEDVALTLGATRAGAFFRVALPLARSGLVAGGVLVWARAFGLFGPLIVFVGAVRMRTEVLPTTVYLEQSVGRLESALVVTLFMLAVAVVALMVIRSLTDRWL